MNPQFVLKIAAPTIVISGLLLALGIVAAWNVQRQQINSSELIAREVHGMIAAQDLYIDMREIRHQLQQHLRSRDARHLEEIQKLREAVLKHIEGRRLTFAVSVDDNRGLVAAGKVTRVMVDVERFMDKTV